jgi:hypothetical protein
MSSSKHKNIPVKPETAERLYERKEYDETWDETIRRLVDD